MEQQDHTVNELLVYSAVNKQKADYIELHVDIDGKGWENIGGQHCWSPNKIKNLMEYLSNEKKIDGGYYKKISKSITDFSHDNEFLDIANEINKLKLFIEERENEKVKGSQIVE